MNDYDLIEYLRKEEENYLPEPPDGIWDGIVDRLPPVRHRVVLLWLRYVSVAACLALLLGIGSLLIDSPTDDDRPTQIAKKSSNGNDSVGKPKTTKETKRSLSELAKVSYTAKTSLLSAADTTAQVENLATMEQPLPSQNGNNEKNNGNNDKESDNIQRRSHRNDSWFSRDSKAARQHDHESVSISLYAAGIMASNTLSQGSFMVSDAILTDAPVESSPYCNILDLNQDADMETNKHYSLPVRAGVRVAIPINRSLAIESGLAYTWLSSSIESGSDENYYRSEQMLHYVGIPVKLRYKLWQGKRIGVYVSGGGMVEKCVSGKVKTKFIIGGSINAEESQRVSEKPLQLSATFSTGIEADITKNASLFFEPGASYYFNNHSSVDNVYKDKPLNLNLNLGIRINFNK